MPVTREQSKPFPFELDPVIEFYKQKIDLAELEESLKLTVQERFEKLMRRQQEAEELQRAAQQSDETNPTS